MERKSLQEHIKKRMSEQTMTEQNFSVKQFKAETEKWFHPIDGRSVRKVEEIVSEYVNWKLESEGIDAKVIGLAVIGSRCRGLEHDGSDLDIVAEYRGDVREDVLFDILHEDGLQIGEIKVDINPITEEKTGTLASYLANAQEYMDRELEEKAENVSAMIEYGYLWDRMLPLSKEKAMELYQKGVMVQKLYPDDTEKYVQGMEDLQGHDGMFGVERGDWENWRKSQEKEKPEQKARHRKIR
jgi:predicted nucleotidyltransferase